MRNPSPKTKEALQANTVETYISLLKGYLNFNYDFELMDRAPRLRGLMKSIKAQGHEIGVRRKRRALRRRHLRRMWTRLPHVRSTSPNAVNAHALLAVAWHVLARGGELAPAAKVWSARSHPSRADLSFHKSSSLGDHAILWLRPLKKRNAQAATKVPQVIARHDGGGSDAFAALQRLVQFDPIGDTPPAAVPLFRVREANGQSRHLRVKDMRRLIRTRVKELGYERPEEWGAHSCRIGGATDLVAAGDASPLLLQAKGRWGSDIGRIYARMTRRSQIAASRLMQRARGRDFEEIYASFVQPAL